MIVTGIGSRKCPSEVLSFISSLPLTDYTVRSGGADGCDNAFESTTKNIEIYIPWASFNKNIITQAHNTISLGNIASEKVEIAKDLVADIHPSFKFLSRGAQLLHTRNVFQILGRSLNESEKSDAVICWTPDGANTYDKCSRHTGGTGTAIKLASILKIPVYNICNEKDLDSVCDMFNLW